MNAVRIVPGPDGGRLEIQDIPVPAVGAGQYIQADRHFGKIVIAIDPALAGAN